MSLPASGREIDEAPDRQADAEADETVPKHSGPPLPTGWLAHWDGKFTPTRYASAQE